jgi:hypothetical protein
MKSLVTTSGRVRSVDALGGVTGDTLVVSGRKKSLANSPGAPEAACHFSHRIER